jgi:phosphoglucomutase
MGLKVYEVPTGWKYFGNLLDAGLIAICGEESFGTGSDHVREKDGLWAVLAWLSILEAKNAGSSGKFVSVEDIVKEHWRNFGRNYYTRYDYEEVDKDSALKMFAELRQKIKDMSFDVSGSGYELAVADEFSYRDPVDNSFTEKQGIRLLFKDGSRIIFRMSGTGSVGATVRMYIEQYEPSAEKIGADAADALNPLVTLALKISELAKFTGRDKPTVIT